MTQTSLTEGELSALRLLSEGPQRNLGDGAPANLCGRFWRLGLARPDFLGQVFRITPLGRLALDGLFVMPEGEAIAEITPETVRIAEAYLQTPSVGIYGPVMTMPHLLASVAEHVGCDVSYIEMEELECVLHDSFSTCYRCGGLWREDAPMHHSAADDEYFCDECTVSVIDRSPSPAIRALLDRQAASIAAHRESQRRADIEALIEVTKPPVVRVEWGMGE
jgi:hypothetical protein